MTALGIELVGQRNLRSGYFADDPALGRVLTKLDFVKIGISKRPCFTTGEAKQSIEVAFPISAARKLICFYKGTPRAKPAFLIAPTTSRDTR